MTTTPGTPSDGPRLRREPPRFRRVGVREVTARTPWLTRVMLGGPELVGMPVPEAAASVRLLLPSPGSNALVVPEWNGNEFLLPDGTRPVLRTFTPWRDDEGDDHLAIDVVDHGTGAASEWARNPAGTAVALSGPGRGSAPAPDASLHLLLGDESAIPAIEQVLAALPADARVQVVVELTHDDGGPELAAGVDWRWRGPDDAPGATLLDAVRTIELDAQARVWAAGEAAGMQRIRRHLFEERGIDRRRTIVRGYWKIGRAEGAPGDGPGDNDDAAE